MPHHDFNEDAGDQLKRLLARQAATRALHQPNFAKPVQLAGQQLELLKPAVLAMTVDGLYAGPAAQVARGTILIVLANVRQVLTIYLPMPPEGPAARRDFLDARVEEVQAMLDEPWLAAHTISAMAMAIAEHGAPPGQAREVDSEVVGRIGGIILAYMSTAERHELLAGIEELVREDVCPAVVGLIGASLSGKEDTFSGAWPLVLPLARYVDAVA